MCFYFVSTKKKPVINRIDLISPEPNNRNPPNEVKTERDSPEVVDNTPSMSCNIALTTCLPKQI